MIDGRSGVVVGVIRQCSADLVDTPAQIAREQVANARRLMSLVVEKRDQLDESVSGGSVL